MALFCLAAMVRKDEPGKQAWCLLNGYRIASSEAEAKGLFMDFAQREKPGYAVVDMLAKEVSLGALEAGEETLT